jgi:cobaltochelatase CobN
MLALLLSQLLFPLAAMPWAIAAEIDPAVQAVSEASTVDETRTAIESEALGLDLSLYNSLADTQKLSVAQAVYNNTPFETREQIQALVDQEVMKFARKFVVLTGRTGFDLLFTSGKERAAYSIDLEILRTSADAATLAGALQEASVLMIITHSSVNAAELEKFRDVLLAHRAAGGVIVIPTLPNESVFATAPGHPDHPFMSRYWINGGGENFRRLYNYIGNKFLGLEAVPVEPPVEIPVFGIVHPKAPSPFATLESYLEWYKGHGYDSSKPLVGIEFFKIWVAREQLEPVYALVEALEAKGANVVPIYLMTAAERNAAGGGAFHYPELGLFERDGRTLINSMVTFVHHGAPGPLPALVERLSRLNVPLLQAVATSLTAEEWAQSRQGMPIPSIPMLLIPPELRGAIDPVVIAAAVRLPSGDTISRSIPEQVEHFAGRAAGWARLGVKANQDKKIAIVYYNYPAGRQSAAGASNLNVFSSLPGVLEAMIAAGYTTDAVTQEQLERILTHEVRNLTGLEDSAIESMVSGGRAALLPVETYLEWFNQLPPERKAELVNAWGPPPGNSMVYTDQAGNSFLVLPRLELGNIILAPQPLRAGGGNELQNIHSTTLPPTHQYVAFYLWLNREFGADAVVHFGTHGSLEFLPGKERSLAASDWPMLLVQDMPIIYPYIMDNIGEGLTARRRGSAVLISHLTPPLIAAGLYGDLMRIHDYIHLYLETDVEKVREGYRQAILDSVKELNLHRDLGVDLADIPDFRHFLDELHIYLHELGEMPMPYGTHTFGRLPEDWLLVATVKGMLGERYKQLVEQKLAVELANLSSLEKEKLIEEKAETILNRLILEELSAEGVQTGELGSVNTELTAILNTALRFWNDFQASREIEALLAALSGRFVLPGPGGDPLRNPGALPTGRNLTAIDPATIPTPVAWGIGKKLVDDLLADYFAAHGEYPDKVAISLWGAETLRTHGVAEAKVLYLLGMEPVWQLGPIGGGMVTGLRAISRNILGRPRIDVVISTTGVHRDLFPNLTVLLHQAVMQAARLEEEDNHVRANALRLLEMLAADGITGDQAFRLATGRIFSAETGGYGTGLTRVEDSGSWEEESELAEIYFRTQGHLYGDGIWSELNVELFKAVLSGTKIALLTRSSNLFGVLTTDDPYQYLGGLGLAIRALDGTSPELWIANLRNPQRARMQTAQTFLLEEARSRYWNPQWIEGQMREGLSGAGQIARVLENLWGWQVMAPEIVEEFVWREMKRVYIEDIYNLELREWFNNNNPFAFQSIVGRMLETVRKGYWNLSPEELSNLAKIFQGSIDRHGQPDRPHLNTPDFLSFLRQALPQPVITPPVEQSPNLSVSDRETETVTERQIIATADIPPAPIIPQKPREALTADPVSSVITTHPFVEVAPAVKQPAIADLTPEEEELSEPALSEADPQEADKREEPRQKARELIVREKADEQKKVSVATVLIAAASVGGIMGLGHLLLKVRMR